MRTSSVLRFLALGVAVSALPARQAVNSYASGRLAHREDEEDADTVDITGTFGTTVSLQGSNVKQDTKFTAGTTGSLEIEFSNTDGRNLTVTEVTDVGNAPDGYALLEPVAYKVKIKGGSAKNLTLSKVDYIQNTDSTTDISQGQVGRLDKDTNTYVIGGSTSNGAIEYEADERELTQKVFNLKGEWAILIPTAATATSAAASATATA